MSNGDWNLYNSGFSGVPLNTPGVDTQGFTTISGVWSLRFAGSGAFQYANFVPRSPIEHGFLHGKISTLVEFDAAHTSPNNAGVMCLLNQEDQRAGFGGRGYAFQMENVLFSRSLRLVELTDGLSFGNGGGPTSTYNLIGTTTGPDWALGTAYKLELEYHVEPFYSGVHLIAKFGLATGSLTTIFNILYNGSAIWMPTVSAGEGIGCISTTNITIVYMDKTVTTQLKLPITKLRTDTVAPIIQGSRNITIL